MADAAPALDVATRLAVVEWLTAVFNAGHYPNPVGHGFALCDTCRSAKAFADAITLLERPNDR